MKPSTVLATLAALTSLLATSVAGHGHMIQPKGRTSSSFGDPSDKHACDSDKPGQVTSYAAGQEIDVVWVRNNHIGGFIRYSLVPKNSVSKANFDQNAFFYTCRESQCDLKKCTNKYCGDDAGAGDNGIKCRAKIKLPDHLAAGDYVLQWTWHAAGSSYGHVGWSTSNFKTCADIKLTTSGTASKPQCPTFVGGDRVTLTEKGMSDDKRTGQCFYYDDNGIGKKIVEYSDEEGYKRYKFGVPKEIETCKSSSGNAPPPTATNTTVPSTRPATQVPSPTKDNGSEGGNGGEDDAPGTVVPWTDQPWKQQAWNQQPAKAHKRRHRDSSQDRDW